MAFFIACLVLAPLVSIAWLALTNPTITLLGGVEIIKLAHTSFWLIALTMMASLIFGASTAWCVSQFQFFGRGFLIWLLILPLAMPAYILAYVYADFLSYGGWVQIHLRDLFGFDQKADYFFPDIRSLGGAALVLSLALYPYVYLAAFSVFSQASSSFVRASRVLGLSAVKSFFKMALPLARPALAISLMLVALECLNDIGVVEHFGVRTLTLGFYDIWLNRGQFESAVQIALLMMMFAFGLIILERFWRRRQRYFLAPAPHLDRVRLSYGHQAIAFMICATPPFFGFILPMAILANMSAAQNSDKINQIANLWSYIDNSLILALGAVIVIGVLGLFLAYISRLTANPFLKVWTSFAVMGYGLPGVVLGLGIILFIISLSHFIDLGDVFMTGYKILLFAYFVRFLAIPHGVMSAGLARISPSLDISASLLGASAIRVFKTIHLPLLRAAFLGALTLSFTEIMRELPMTLIIRPANFETLATHIYGKASLGLLEETALAAFLLGLLGLIGALFWFRAINAGSNKRVLF